MAFKIGDEVRLKSGGPAMTVNAIEEDGDYECVWFDEKHVLKTEYFKEAILKPRGQAVYVA